MNDIIIKSKEIKLDQFLKWANIVMSGGEAKSLIQAGKVKVNGEIEYRRSHKIKTDDIVEIEGFREKYRVIKN
ncbi:RNA-binding protein [Iocasia frigidifontis]|uniref:RNA-binding protein n=1 Tax=Iocasia fonsfrigidae TaxID=2682810 RepID=A0A8A7K592_9FIRM|nr:RNA-binding S4 domain-containing protein [Iocasia fonsfrigidae]QTL96471.1 RNA-binding protein [Iocasia fonsfrigidae]